MFFLKIGICNKYFINGIILNQFETIFDLKYKLSIRCEKAPKREKLNVTCTFSENMKNWKNANVD